MKQALNISPQLTLPVAAVTETFAILAVKRAGKSNAAVVMAEELYDAGLPWIAIDPKGDWWGVRAAGARPGLENVVVFGGLHADIPLEPTAGNLLADLIVEHRLTCVLDVSEMTKADQRRFLTDFAARLYRRNTEPLHVFCEEADEYIPQRVMGENTKLVGAFETLVKRGGFRGIGITLVTQRSASLNKDVLTQAGTLIAMRTPSPQDRKAVLAWIDYHAASKDVIDELPTLAAGEAWVFSPEWLKKLTKIRFRMRRTFDSGATPKVGGKPRPAAKLADVDLAAVKGAMAETIEKSKAEDPKFWRAQHAGVTKELHELAAKYEALYTEHRDHVCQGAEKIIEVPVVGDARAEQLRGFCEDLLAQTELQAGFVERLEELAQQMTADLARATAATQPSVSAAVLTDITKTAAMKTKPQPLPPQLSAPRGGTSYSVPAELEGVQLRAGARRMVKVLGRMAPMRLTTAQWSVIAKIKRSGGTWGTYLSEIKRLGLVEENSTGWTLTDAGFDYIGGRPTPMTLEELRAHYRSLLREGARRMLEVITASYPNDVDLDYLSAQAEISRAGGTFGTYLSDLIRNQLVEKTSRSTVRATDLWFSAP